MSQFGRVAVLATILGGCSTLTLLAADPGVTLVARGLVPGSDLDASGLKGKICKVDDATNCIPKATLGGFGSGMTATGNDDVFIGVSDRGPFDGRTNEPYLDRFHFFHFGIIPSTTQGTLGTVKATLLDTRFFRNEVGERLV